MFGKSWTKWEIEVLVYMIEKVSRRLEADVFWEEEMRSKKGFKVWMMG